MRKLTIPPTCSGILFIAGIFANLLVAGLNGVLGALHRSAWQGTLCAYYLALMLLKLYVLYRGVIQDGERGGRYWRLVRLYGVCSISIILLDFLFGGIVYLVATEQGTKHYPGVLIYGVALYAFCKIGAAIRNLVRASRLQAPMMMAVRSIGYADALVSMLMLETALIDTFGERSEAWVMVMTAASGSAFWFLILLVGSLGVWWCWKREEGKEKSRYDL